MSIAPSQFTCCWCIKLNYDSSCVFYTMYGFDAFLFIVWGAYAFGLLGRYVYWPQIIFIIFSVILLLMGIFALVQIFTKNSSAAGRHANYTKYRMWIIIAYIVLAVVMFILWLIWGVTSKVIAGFWIAAAISSAIPYLFNAAVLHGYHANFAGGSGGSSVSVSVRHK